MTDAGASDQERAALLRAAVTNHSKISLEAKIGKGMDRHMFALRDVALRRAGGEGGDAALPAIFTEPAYAALGEVILSTSTLSSDALVGGGFGPVGPQCYALGCVERCSRFLIVLISLPLSPLTSHTHTHARTHTYTHTNSPPPSATGRYGIEKTGARFSAMSYGRDSATLLGHVEASLREIRDLVSETSQ